MNVPRPQNDNNEMAGRAEKAIFKSEATGNCKGILAVDRHNPQQHAYATNPQTQTDSY